MVITIDTQKAFDKIQCPCMIKSLRKLGIEQTFCNTIYDKLTASIKHKMGKYWKHFHENAESKMLTLITIIQYNSGHFSHSHRKEESKPKGKKGLQTGKEETEL